jgi:hypothetical protein
MVVIILLVSWLIIGGAIFLAVRDAVREAYGFTSLLAFAITSFVGVLFSFA